MKESRAVGLLLTLAVLGHGVRLLLQPHAAPPGQLLARTAPALDPAQQRARAGRVARPLGAGERVDLNTASAEEIARLPRIGMSLAKRIVADRKARGPYGGLPDLDRVPGIGPSLLGILGERVRFSGAASGDAARGESAATLGFSGVYNVGSGPASGGPVDLNSASEKELVALPGIGRARALAILAYRRENGPFAVVSDLGRVPGFSRALVTRLSPWLQVR
jgi:competence ComEA-like helix-hairpin-helix protein